MKKMKELVLLILLSLFLSSCYQVLFKKMGVLEESASIEKAGNGQKQVVYIPMHHIGKSDFYEDVKSEIDSLRKEGFVFYYEGVQFSKEYDSLRNDTLAMKLRKISGVDFRAMKSQGGYIDTLNNTLLGLKVKSISTYKLVNQPKNAFYFDTLTDRRVDIYLSDALPAFEEKFGKIELSDCDFTTKPADKYHCKRIKNKAGKKFLLLDYRDDFIANEILNDPRPKIALVYGAKHFNGILRKLQARDASWKASEK